MDLKHCEYPLQVHFLLCDCVIQHLVVKWKLHKVKRALGELLEDGSLGLLHYSLQLLLVFLHFLELMVDQLQVHLALVQLP